MSKEIRARLKNANSAYKNGDYEEAERIYNEIYDKNPEKFNRWDKIYYAWSLYKNRIRNPQSEEDLIKAGELIIDLVKQKNFSKKEQICPYTVSISSILKYYADDLEKQQYWLNKLNPDFLSSKPFIVDGNKGKQVKHYSKKEKWYSRKTKYLYQMGEYEETIELCKRILDEMDDFTSNSDIWFKWRIGLSNKCLGNYSESLMYINEIAKIKNDWYVQKELAEIYQLTDDVDKAFKHAINGALIKGDVKNKINLYRLLSEILDEKGLKEAEKVDDLIIAIEDNENFIELEKNLRLILNNLKFLNQEKHYGTIINLSDNGFGFVKDENNNNYYFKTYETEDLISVGSYVSFYLEEGFDKKKNEVKLNAVNIHLE